MHDEQRWEHSKRLVEEAIGIDDEQERIALVSERCDDPDDRDATLVLVMAGAEAARADPGTLTCLAQAAANGERTAREEFWSRVMPELVKMARCQLRHQRHLMSAESLANIGYQKLDRPGVVWESRRHFFGAAIRAMWQVRIDRIRQEARKQELFAELAEMELGKTLGQADQARQVLAIDVALSRLANFNERWAHIAMLRFGFGFTIDESAELLGLSPRTIDKHWRLARAWIRRELDGEGNDESGTDTT